MAQKHREPNLVRLSWSKQIEVGYLCFSFWITFGIKGVRGDRYGNLSTHWRRRLFLGEHGSVPPLPQKVLQFKLSLVANTTVSGGPQKWKTVRG